MFGLLENLITDNGKRFEAQLFEDFYCMREIQHTKSSITYPHANNQVENTRRTIMDGLKKMLEEASSKWVDNLQYILSQDPKRVTVETPFALTYGFEAKVLIEVL